MDQDKQWRIDSARFLKGVRLERQKYQAPDEHWDHDHCVGCWAKFAEFDAPEILHEGYTTCEDYKYGASYHWVCDECFADLKDEMEWTLVISDVH